MVDVVVYVHIIYYLCSYNNICALLSLFVTYIYCYPLICHPICNKLCMPNNLILLQQKDIYRLAIAVAVILIVNCSLNLLPHEITSLPHKCGLHSLLFWSRPHLLVLTCKEVTLTTHIMQPIGSSALVRSLAGAFLVEFCLASCFPSSHKLSQIFV